MKLDFVLYKALDRRLKWLWPCGCNSVVEFLPSKQVVAGSNPVARSTFFRILNHMPNVVSVHCVIMSHS